MLFLGFEISGKIREDSPGNWSSGALGSVFTIFALSAAFLPTKNQYWKKQVTRTPLRGVLVTCISNIDFFKLGTSG